MSKTTLTLSELIAKTFKIYTVQTKSSMHAQSLVVEENALLHHREAVAAELGATDRKLKALEGDLKAAGHTSGGFGMTLESEIANGRCPRGWGELCIYPDGTKPTTKDCAQCFKDQGDHSDD